MMKRSVIIIGLSLMLMVSGNGLLNAQRGMGVMRDSTRLGMRRVMPGMQMHGMMQNADSLTIRGTGYGMGHMRMNNAGMGQMRMNNAAMMHMRTNTAGMRHMVNPAGMRHMNSAGMRQWSPGMMMLESIPNVTEKQKKEIADLRLKQQDEMQKLREKSAAEMQTMRETHRKNMMNILTDEQKKFLESKSVKTDLPPVTNK